MEINNPATNKILQEIEEDNQESVAQKYQLLKKGQKKWAAHPLKERIQILYDFSLQLAEQQDKLANVLSLEMGKPIQESKNEIKGAIYRIGYFLEHAKEWLTEKKMNQAGNTEEILAYQPLGVIGNISAWNYPYLVGVNVFVPALISGNAVLYKPSEYATLTGLEIEKLLHQVKVPQDVFKTVVGKGNVGQLLLGLPLEGYFFTGSYKTGKYIAEQVASKLVPVGLELGGKDPLYVTDEIKDIKQVAEAVGDGCFYNNGQSCCSVERIYVQEKVYSDFIKHFLAYVKTLKVGDPFEGSNTQGAIARPEHINYLEKQVRDATAKGAKVLIGGRAIKGEGAFFEPTVLADVNHEMSLMKEETFGPVIGIQKVKEDKEAIELMQDTDYGLTASVFSLNTNRARQILEQLDTGTGYVNCSDRVSPYLPWSGRKKSGLGSTLSYLGLLAFCKPKGYHLRQLE